MVQIEIEGLPDINEITLGEKGLERTWGAFLELSRIPRPSGGEKEVIKYIEQFAEQRKFKTETDKAGNVLFIIPATEGNEGKPGIIFQSHLDMVCETDGEQNPKDSGVKVQAVRDEDGLIWLHANDTTLGADNGIGVALMLAIAQENIPHGPLAFMFTNREEVGLVGAREMDFENRLEEYAYLINLDTEEEGEATVSCAGAGDTFINFSGMRINRDDKRLIRLKLEGLMGGHSGMVIAEGRLNAVKTLAASLMQLRAKLGPDAVNLVSFEGGTARNAIPKEAISVIAVTNDLDGIEQILEEMKGDLLKTSRHPDKEREMKFTVEAMESDGKTMLDDCSTEDFLMMVDGILDGLITEHPDIHGFPQTSSNIGIVETGDDGDIKIQIMTRSSKDDEKDQVRNKIRMAAEQKGAIVEQPEGYSGWPAVKDSRVNMLISRAWQVVSGRSVVLRITHGGLECGAIIGKFPHLEAISIGPEIIGAHTTQERVKAESVRIYYDLLKIILRIVLEE